MHTYAFLLFCWLASVGVALAQEQRLRETQALTAARILRATRTKPLPREQQQLGYQFYAALPIPKQLRQSLMAHYAALAELDQNPDEIEGVPMEQVLAHTIAGLIDRSNFDNMRKAAQDECKKYRRSIGKDPCTAMRFSPFELVCELTIVVTAECSLKRPELSKSDGIDAYDLALANLLHANSACAAGCENMGMKINRMPVPRPEQAYEDFVERRDILRRAARNLAMQ